MGEVVTGGLDIAKSIFQVHGISGEPSRHGAFEPLEAASQNLPMLARCSTCTLHIYQCNVVIEYHNTGNRSYDASHGK